MNYCYSFICWWLFMSIASSYCSQSYHACDIIAMLLISTNRKIHVLREACAVYGQGSNDAINTSNKGKWNSSPIWWTTYPFLLVLSIYKSTLQLDFCAKWTTNVFHFFNPFCRLLLVQFLLLIFLHRNNSNITTIIHLYQLRT